MAARKYRTLWAALEDLRETLEKQGKWQYTASFEEVERWSQITLPPSAYSSTKFWSNNSRNSTNADRPWERAGFRTEGVDLDARTVVFHRQAPSSSPRTLQAVSQPAFLSFVKKTPEGQQPGFSDTHRSRDHEPSVVRHPLRGALKGTLRIVAGTDLTKPADPDWADRS